jgi:hypothetical protein
MAGHIGRCCGIQERGVSNARQVTRVGESDDGFLWILGLSGNPTVREAVRDLRRRKIWLSPRRVLLIPANGCVRPETPPQDPRREPDARGPLWYKFAARAGVATDFWSRGRSSAGQGPTMQRFAEGVEATLTRNQYRGWADWMPQLGLEPLVSWVNPNTGNRLYFCYCGDYWIEESRIAGQLRQFMLGEA